MECNRDEAMRARDIAEKKFAMQDFAGAKKFVIKAQQLYPPLDGAIQMLAVLDVHIAAQVKFGINETDWYGILQVEPLSDDSTIKKQYRKLALMLHPDKNKSMGAEAAFKLIGEAFGVLSDKAKRYLHDSKRSGEYKISQVASQATEPSKPTYSAYQAQNQAAATTTPATGVHAPHTPNTFWTACPLCRMQYQYMRTYLGYQLLCQKCHKPFLANDINAHPANGTNAFSWPRGPFENNGSFSSSPVPPKKSAFNFQPWVRNGGVAPGNVAGNGYAHFTGSMHTAGIGNSTPCGNVGAGASAAAAASLVHEAYRKAQRDRVDAERELKRKEKEKEKLLRQQEREALKKARENAKTHEAMERLMKRREEAIRKAAMKAGTKKRLKKRKRDDDDEDEDEDEYEDDEDLEPSNSAPRSRADFVRKSSRLRRYAGCELGASDNEFEATPLAKKFSDVRVEKGKSLVCEGDDDDDDEKEEDEEEEEDIWGDGSGSGSKPIFVRDRLKDPLQEQLAERFRRELAAKLGIPTRDSSQVSRAKMDDEQSQMAVNASSNAKFVPHSGNSSVLHVNVNGTGGPDKDATTAGTAGIGKNCTVFSEGSGEEVIVVPDPDFHDFDVDRTERHVRKNQVWAVFDETDGMPRFYCQVNKVRRDPFIVDAVWLEPVHPLKDTFHWLMERDLSISCGEFKLGDEVEFHSINMFSHLMTSKRYKNGYEVYPKRPEVWAIYRDYDKEMRNSNAVGRVQFRYDFVLIRSDFSAITGGGRVVRLEKLPGYKTLWVPKGDAYPLTVKYDLHKFSHRVPALLVTEENIEGVPAECLELDPASTPADSIEP